RAGFEFRADIGNDAMKERIDRALRPVERLLTGTPPRRHEQIANEAFNAKRVALDRLEDPTFVRWIGDAVEQRFDVAAHSGQGCSEFVRNVGDEVAPDPIGSP